MKKALVLLTAFLLLFTLVSCSSGEAVPDGMQLGYSDNEMGYKFYVPSGWIISNTGNIRAAYASRLDTSSISFAKVELSDEQADNEAYFFGTYFSESLAEFPSEPEITLNGEIALFGKKDYEADKAIKYIFNYEYASHKFTTMQILIKKSENYFIFTYTALNEARNDEETYYAFHLEEIQKCIEEFMFTEPSASVGDETVYEKDADGYLLYSDSSLAGFSLYVSPDFSLDYASAIVSATHKDGSNVTMTRATAAGVTVDKYWETRQTELAAIVSELTVIRENAECRFGNATKKFCYEYSFTYNGKQFKVYQVLAVYGMDGYVFTYTAESQNYDAHINAVMKITDKVVLK